MTSDAPPTSPEPGAAILAGVRLLNIARTAMAHCEHALNFLDTDGMPQVAIDDLPAHFTTALGASADLHVALEQLVDLLRDRPRMTPLVHARIEELAELLVAGETDREELMRTLTQAVTHQLLSTDAIGMLHGRVRELVGSLTKLEDDKAVEVATDVLASLVPHVISIATDDKFGRGDVAFRIRALLEHSHTIREVADHITRGR